MPARRRRSLSAEGLRRSTRARRAPLNDEQRTDPQYLRGDALGPNQCNNATPCTPRPFPVSLDDSCSGTTTPSAETSTPHRPHPFNLVEVNGRFIPSPHRESQTPRRVDYPREFDSPEEDRLYDTSDDDESFDDERDAAYPSEVIIIATDLPQMNDTLQQLILEAASNGFTFQRDLASVGLAHPLPLAFEAESAADVINGVEGQLILSKTQSAIEGAVITAALAIVARRNDRIEQCFSIHKMPAEPTAINALAAFIESSHSSSRDVTTMLKQMMKAAADVSTAVQLLRIEEWMEHTHDWNAGYRRLGSWWDLENCALPPKIKRCSPSLRCQEALAAHAPEVPEDTPIYFLGIQELPNEAGPSAVLRTTAASSAHIIASDNNHNDEPRTYLRTFIDQSHFDLVNTHVRGASNNTIAYGHIIFARIVEVNCTRFGVVYTDRCNQTIQAATAHGTPVSMNDIIQAFDFMKPSTFSNVRNLLFRARRAVELLQLVDTLDRADREYLESLKSLLEVKLRPQELDSINRSTFGSLIKITKRLQMLLTKFSQRSE